MPRRQRLPATRNDLVSIGPEVAPASNPSRPTARHALWLRPADPELLQGTVLCGRQDLHMIFNAYHCALLGVDGMRRRLFLQMEGNFHRHRTMVGSELDLSGGYWFESSRRSHL